MKKYFEIITKLENAIEDEFELELIKDALNHFNEYINIVSTESTRINLAKLRLDTKDFQDFVSSLDYERRAKHNECISDLNVLNKLCRDYKICHSLVNTELDRDKIGDEIKNIVTDIFNNRKR